MSKLERIIIFSIFSVLRSHLCIRVKYSDNPLSFFGLVSLELCTCVRVDDGICVAYLVRLLFRKIWAASVYIKQRSWPGTGALLSNTDLITISCFKKNDNFYYYHENFWNLQLQVLLMPMRPVSWTVWSAVFNTTVIFKWPRDSHLSVCSRGFIHDVLKLEFWENKQRIKSAISI